MSERKSSETRPDPLQLCERADQLLESIYGKATPGNRAAMVDSVHVIHLLPDLLVNPYPGDPFRADEAEELGGSAQLYLLTRILAGDGHRRYDFRELGAPRRYRARHSPLSIAWDNTPQSLLTPGLGPHGDNRSPELLEPAERDELCTALQEGQAYDPEQLMLREMPDGSLQIMPRSEHANRMQNLRTEQSPMGELWRKIFFGNPPLA